MITNWKFYGKTVVLGSAQLSVPWHEITHEHAQDLIYEHTTARATPHIKRMMYSHILLQLGNVLIKMEEVIDAID
jgi:hypothetical protein